MNLHITVCPSDKDDYEMCCDHLWGLEKYVMQIISNYNNVLPDALSVCKPPMMPVFQEVRRCWYSWTLAETARGSRKVIKFNNSHQSANSLCGLKGD